jgi:hypothetical protein
MMEMAEQEMSKAVLEIIDLRLSPILEKLKILSLSDIQHTLDFSKLASKIEEIAKTTAELNSLKKSLEGPQKCPKMEQFEALDGKFKVVANFLENLVYLLVKTEGANPCADDITGLAVLRNEESPSTEGLDKYQLKALFIQQMKTKAF